MSNPLRYQDPDGRAIDTVADIASVAYDLVDIGRSVYRGEGVSGTQVLALGGDVVGALIPFATGIGVAMRTGNKTDVGKATSDLTHAGTVTKTGLHHDAGRQGRSPGHPGGYVSYQNHLRGSQSSDRDLYARRRPARHIPLKPKDQK